MKKKSFQKIAQWLLVIAGLNIGLSLLGFDIISKFVNATATWVGTIINALFGVSALFVGYHLLSKKK